MSVVWFLLSLCYFGIVFCAVCEHCVDCAIKFNKANS